MLAGATAKRKGPTMVVCEVACLTQWKDAFITFGGIRPMIVTSGTRGPTADDEVVLTTYSVFQQKILPEPIKRKWWRIILDEAHKIRNPKTVVHK